jgi:hypothetical protein
MLFTQGESEIVVMCAGLPAGEFGLDLAAFRVHEWDVAVEMIGGAMAQHG